MRLAMFGPPGAGKGTQAKLLEEEYGAPHISTGELFRNAMAEDSPLGYTVQAYIEEGQLVPDNIVWELTKEALIACETHRFILDGYPRTIKQAELLDNYLREIDSNLDVVISLQVAVEVIVRRLSRRRVDRKTGDTYHLDFNPPPSDLPPDRLVQRSDDKPEAIRNRIEVYQRETSPVQSYYDERGLLRKVNGEGDIDIVHERIRDVVEEGAVQEDVSG